MHQPANIFFQRSKYGIGKKYGATEAQLKAWNKLKSNVIHPCQKLIIAAPKTNITAKSVDVPKQYSTVVKPKTVAKTTATKVTAKGVTLKTTAYVKSGTGLHVVLKGETVASLAKKYGISEADFRRINFMGENESVSVGQVIREKTCACTIEEAEDHSLALNPIPVTNDVPGGYNYIGSKSSTSSSTVTAKGINRKYHVVQTSETLYTIAKQYGKSISDIRRLNNLDENEVIIPHQLILLE